MSEIHCEGFEDSIERPDESEQILHDGDCQKISRHVEEARCVLSKSYSLQPDMLHGWIPKIPSIPIPLYYAESLSEIKSILFRDQMYKISYEWKNTKYNSVKLHQAYNYKWDKRQKYEMKLGFLEQAVQKIGRPKSSQLNTKINMDFYLSQYRFNSDFEGGNLELAVRVKPDEYDCYLRSDSNTNGHTNWYWFTVQNSNRLGSVKINICNLKKTRNLYGKGMAPYTKLQGAQEWSQSECQQVNFVERYCRYRPNIKCNHLQFKYIFTMPNQCLHVAYCIPYTYSQLQQYIESIQGNRNVEHLSLGDSFTGLAIPLLKVTNSKKPSVNKKTVVMIGRTHPGQANSSWVIQGILKQLLAESNSSRFLRDRFEFFIIPMLNVDGVVLGNFRCGAQGMDFNRCFDQQLSQKTVQIKHVIDLIQGIKNRGNSVEFVIDFHGHSEQKNCFFYGPQFHPSDKYHMKSRLFGKMFEQKCSSFRFNQSCFHIPEYKKNTARSYMNFVQKIPMVFTLQVSNGVYEVNKQLKQYNRKEFESIGKDLLSTLCEYQKVEQLVERNLKLIEMKKMSNSMFGFGKQRHSVKNTGLREMFSTTNTFNSTRNAIKRSSMKINRSVEVDKEKLAKKRSSQNFNKFYMDQVHEQRQTSSNSLINEKIKIMIEGLCQDKSNKTKALSNVESDIQSEDDDLNQIQRESLNKEIQEWSGGFLRKSTCKSFGKQRINQKFKQTIIPKVNNLFENYNKGAILKEKKPKVIQKDFKLNYEKQRNLKRVIYDRIAIPKKMIRSQIFKKQEIIQLSKSQLISNPNNCISGFGLSLKDQKDFPIQEKENLKIPQEKHKISIYSEMKGRQLIEQANQKKQNSFQAKLSEPQSLQQQKKVVKNSLWSNTNMKNILRSNRFPFVMEKLI